jgi:uncharacterized protein (DUF58 family)
MNGGVSASLASRARRTGSVVSDLSAILLVLIGIVGLWDDRPWITFICALVLIVVLVSRAWARLALTEVSYEPRLSRTQLVQGDTFSLSMTLENKKPFPLPWLRLREIVPSGLELASGSAGEIGKTFNGSLEISETLGLGGYERAHLTLDLKAARRGHYAFGPAHLRSGDIFGFYQVQQTLNPRGVELVVFPKPADLPPIPIPAFRPIGDTVTRSGLTEDISRPNGSREFRAGDNRGRIDWKISARQGAPFVRTFDPSVTECLVLGVDCATNIHDHWGIDTDVLENTISTAATLVTRNLKQGHRLGLVCNGTPLSGQTPPVIPPGAGKGQRVHLMNCLAAAGAITTRPIETLMQHHGASVLPSGAAFLYIAGVIRPSTLDFLKHRQSKGNRILVLYTGRDAPPRDLGLAMIDLRAAFEADETAADSGRARHG